MRELARLALSADWSIDAGIATGEDPAAAVTLYADSLAPLAEVDPELTGSAALEARKWLKPIGMKIAPTMSQEQCSTWLNALMLALSDFPPRVIMQAARSAIRIPMEFMNQVDGHVRAEAEKIMKRHRLALFRLQRLRDAVARASAPVLSAPDGFEGGGMPPMSVDDIKATALTPMGPALLRIGITLGAITQDACDAAIAALNVEAERAGGQ